MTGKELGDRPASTKTLRQELAGLAMQKFAPTPKDISDFTNYDFAGTTLKLDLSKVAKLAILQADALLEALAKEPTQ